MKRGFLDLLDPSNDPDFFWQVISGPPCIFRSDKNVARFFEKYSSASANWQNTCSELFKSQE
jgi:hypothetical protein